MTVVDAQFVWGGTSNLRERLRGATVASHDALETRAVSCERLKRRIEAYGNGKGLIVEVRG